MAGSWHNFLAVSEEAVPEVLPFLMDHVTFNKHVLEQVSRKMAGI